MARIEIRPTAGELARQIAEQLRAAGIDNAAQDARALVVHFAGVTMTELVAGGGREIGAETAETIRAAARRVALGEPLFRILGRRAFYGVELSLTADTLDPRPDTEVLVDRIIPHARRITAAEGACKILDLGTGTGAIALAILQEVEGATALGVDISEGAVAAAARNARLNGLETRFRAVVSDWFSAVNEIFHIIVSNPPYISAQDYASLPDNVRLFDPKSALLGGVDGLDAYRAIAASAAGYLHADGVVGVETGYDQREAVSEVFAQRGFRLIESASDLAGHDRVLLFSR